MLKRLYVKNFTVFSEANFEFGPGLNVVVGTNGTGKSHVLKLGYAVLRAANTVRPSKSFEYPEVHWADVTQNILQSTFLPDALHDLIHRPAVMDAAAFRVDWGRAGEHTAAFEIPSFPDIDEEGTRPDVYLVDELVSIATPAKNEGSNVAPVFIPAKEVLSTYSGFLALYENREVDYDLTYPDLCRYLSLPNLRESKQGEVLDELVEVMGGAVRLNGQRFVFEPKGEHHPLSIHLYAEGLRKFGILWQLLRNGSLTPQTTLFWDEPEANLNPALLRKLAAVLTELARQGFQIILATHSLFLLNELHILAHNTKSTVRYFGLYQVDTGDTKVEQTDDLETLNHLVALEEEMAQTVRFQRVLDDEFLHENDN